MREMFDRIAGHYELLNTVMTAGLHCVWNRKAVWATGLQPVTAPSTSPVAPVASREISQSV